MSFLVELLKKMLKSLVLPDFWNFETGKFPQPNFLKPNIDSPDKVVDVVDVADVDAGINVDIHCMLEYISATNCTSVRFNLNALQKSPIFGPFIQSIWHDWTIWII